MGIMKSEIDDARQAMHSLGYYDEDEFHFAWEPSSQLGPGVQPIIGEVRVARSNGIERRYAGGHGSKWPVEFEEDLEQGKFGPREDCP
jgi:hypothetical protein